MFCFKRKTEKLKEFTEKEYDKIGIKECFDIIKKDYDLNSYFIVAQFSVQGNPPHYSFIEYNVRNYKNRFGRDKNVLLVFLKKFIKTVEWQEFDQYRDKENRKCVIFTSLGPKDIEDHKEHIAPFMRVSHINLLHIQFMPSIHCFKKMVNKIGWVNKPSVVFLNIAPVWFVNEMYPDLRRKVVVYKGANVLPSKMVHQVSKKNPFTDVTIKFS